MQHVQFAESAEKSWIWKLICLYRDFIGSESAALSLGLSLDIKTKTLFNSKLRAGERLVEDSNNSSEG